MKLWKADQNKTKSTKYTFEWCVTASQTKMLNNSKNKQKRQPFTY